MNIARIKKAETFPQEKGKSKENGNFSFAMLIGII
jgi:hypothetical protein